MTKGEALEKFDEQLADLEVAGQVNSDVYNWIKFQRHQWEHGTMENVRVVSDRERYVKENGLAVYIPPRYEDQWTPAPITYGVFMNWKFKKLTN